MLDSRYVHLHDALGLGVMWLKKGARVIGQPVVQERQITSAASMLKKHKNQKNMPLSRLEVLQKFSGNVGHNESTPESTSIVQSVEPIHAVSDYLLELSGKIPSVKLMVLSVCASPDDVLAGQLFSGADGQLLTKMLAAINLSQQDVFISTWLKNLPDFNPKPSTETVTAAAPRVQAEYQLSGARALLLLGSFFDRSDVKSQLPDTKVFTIAHPQRILNDRTLKRSAWETLQQLEQFLQ